MMETVSGKTDADLSQVLMRRGKCSEIVESERVINTK